jgi:conjugative transfer pilus assembly protein TraH
MRRKLVTILAVGALVLGGAPPAAASVSSNMDAYWNDGLSAASATGPHGAYSAQAGGYYTPGNLSMRMPQKNYQIASIAMPSLKGGCGGIDLFTGAFSFISADQLVAMIKGIAQNAVSYAFMLALQLISAPIADELSKFEKWAQDVNSFNINSCEAATKLVDGAVDALGAKGEFCQQLGRAHGTFSDAAAARLGCAGDNALSAATARTADEQRFDPVNRNFAWDAIQSHPMLAGDHEMAELMMTITGSIIVTCPADARSGAACVTTPLAPQGANPAIISALMDGGTIRIHACDEFVQCLYPSQLTGTATIKTGLKQRALKEMTGIVDNIRARTPLTKEQVSFVNESSLPIYKMASVYASIHGLDSGAAMAQYSEIVALDMAYSWLEQMVKYAAEGQKSIHGISPEDLTAWQANLGQVRAELVAREQTLPVQASAIEQMIARTQQIEAVLTGQAAGRIAQSIAYAAPLGQYQAQ